MSKISAYSELGATPDALDEFVIVDKSDTTMSANGTTKKVQAQYLTIADASTTVKGKVELLTDAETITGTDPNRAMTASNLTAKMDTDGTLAGNLDTRIPSQKAVKTYGDRALNTLLTRIPLYAPQGFLINGKISVTDTGSGLKLELLTLAGTAPSATDPVYVRIGDTVRTVSAALSVTKADGTNWMNAGSAELATKEIDYFAYLGYNATDGVVIGFSRIIGNQYSDFSVTTTNEKYAAISTITTAASTDYYEVVGRFAATLSAGAGYTWSVPTYTAINLIQRPIYETRLLTWSPVWTGYSSSPAGTNKYRMNRSRCRIDMSNTDNLGTSNANTNKFTTPFAPAETMARMMGSGFGWNNSAGLASFRIEWTAGTALMTTYIDKDGNVWTTSGTKAINIFGMEFEI